VAPTTVITQYEVLIGDIKEARTKAAEVTFDLTDKKGIAAAKSYVFSLRRLNGRIDEAHKEAKAETLERGKAIDRVKNVLREQVAALIQPHQDALDAIAKAEAERVAKHRQVIDTIKDAARLPFGSTSQQIAGIQGHIKALDLAGLEEFEVEAKAAWADTMQTLSAAHATAQEAEQKVAAAQAEAKAATQRALNAEAVVDLLQSEALLEIKPAEVFVPQERETVLLDKGSGRMDFGMALLGGFPAPRQPAWPRQTATAPATDAEATAALVDTQIALRLELMQALSGRTRAEVADALIDGTLHHAIQVNWAAMAPGGQG
jgi:hypothetical protein